MTGFANSSSTDIHPRETSATFIQEQQQRQLAKSSSSGSSDSYPRATATTVSLEQ